MKEIKNFAYSVGGQSQGKEYFFLYEVCVLSNENEKKLHLEHKTRHKSNNLRTEKKEKTKKLNKETKHKKKINKCPAHVELYSDM